MRNVRSLTRRPLRSVTGLAVAVAATLTLAAAPATAATRDVTDKVGDVAAGVDITKVRIVHGDRVRVKTWHRNLTRQGSQGASVYLDFDTSRPGPELGLFGGLNAGTDYGLSRVRDWKQVGDQLTCWHDLDVDYAADTSLVRIGRGCLGNANRVRVAVKVGQYKASSGTEVRDWLVSRRHLTAWVPRG